MTKLTDWIRDHQVAAFFILTFAITWGLVDRMWEKLPPDHPAVYREPALDG